MTSINEVLREVLHELQPKKRRNHVAAAHWAKVKEQKLAKRLRKQEAKKASRFDQDAAGFDRAA